MPVTIKENGLYKHLSITKKNRKLRTNKIGFEKKRMMILIII